MIDREQDMDARMEERRGVRLRPVERRSGPLKGTLRSGRVRRRNAEEGGGENSGLRTNH